MVGSVVQGVGTLVEEEEVVADSAAMEGGDEEERLNREERKKAGGYMKLMQATHLMQFVVQATPSEQLSDHLDISFLSRCRRGWSGLHLEWQCAHGVGCRDTGRLQRLANS